MSGVIGVVWSAIRAPLTCHIAMANSRSMTCSDGAGSASAHGTEQGNCILTWVNWDRLGVNGHWDGVWLGSRGVVWGRLGVVWFRGVGHSLVLDVGDVSVLVVGVVGDDLSPAVGEGDAVLAGNNTIVILKSRFVGFLKQTYKT